MERAIRRVPTPGAPRGVTTTRAPDAGLPPDLLREASRRLGLIARFFIVMPLVVATVLHTILPRFNLFWPTAPLDVIAGIVVVLSFGVLLATRSNTADPASIIKLGLAYEIALAAAMAAADHVLAGPATMTMTAGPTISRVMIILLAFPVFVPSPPLRTLVAALLAASMDPLAMVVTIHLRHLDVAPGYILLMHVPDYITVPLAVLMSRVITGLGRHVRDARDLGSYRLGELLGRGGMGEVYVAHHRMLARPAAIKLIRPETLDVEGHQALRIVERFRREAEAVASLRSPHTIELYDFGQTEDGTLYFVMELLDGINLDSFVERFGPMPPARVVHVLCQACDSLGEAHAHGLIHRDVKPANIHLCRMGLQHDYVKVLDFGIVKSQRPPVPEPALATAANRVIGTPAFIPPEMATGGAVDGRADLYGLGCLGYWLLTGQLVFEGATPYEVVSQHITAAPVPPSVRSGLQIPPALEKVILACLAKEPERRPPDGPELARRLEACALPQQWTERQAQEWWRDHMPAAAGAAWEAGVSGDRSAFASTV